MKNVHKFRDMGICFRCRGPIEPERAGRMECASCAARTSVRTKKRYTRLVSAGLCVDCGLVPPVEGRRLCEKCAVNRKISDIRCRRVREAYDQIRKGE